MNEDHADSLGTQTKDSGMMATLLWGDVSHTLPLRDVLRRYHIIRFTREPFPGTEREVPRLVFKFIHKEIEAHYSALRHIHVNKPLLKELNVLANELGEDIHSRLLARIFAVEQCMHGYEEYVNELRTLDKILPGENLFTWREEDWEGDEPSPIAGKTCKMVFIDEATEPAPPQKLLSAEEAADWLNVSLRTLARWRGKGGRPSVREYWPTTCLLRPRRYLDVDRVAQGVFAYNGTCRR